MGGEDIDPDCDYRGLKVYERHTQEAGKHHGWQVDKNCEKCGRAKGTEHSLHSMCRKAVDQGFKVSKDKLKKAFGYVEHPRRPQEELGICTVIDGDARP